MRVKRSRIAGVLGEGEAAAVVVAVHLAIGAEMAFCVAGSGAADDRGEVGIFARAVPIAEIGEEADSRRRGGRERR